MLTKEEVNKTTKRRTVQTIYDSFLPRSNVAQGENFACIDTNNFTQWSANFLEEMESKIHDGKKIFLT